MDGERKKIKLDDWHLIQFNRFSRPQVQVDEHRQSARHTYPQS